MKMHQSITMRVPMAGSAPRGIAGMVRTPTAPVRNFRNIKEAVQFLKKEEKGSKDER